MKLRAVGYESDSEIVTFSQRCWSMRCKKPGIDVDYLNTALKLAGLEAEVISSNYPIPQALQMIENGSADITVHAIIQNTQRLESVDFTIPINYIVYGYLAKEVQEFQVREFILNSICAEVLLFLIFALISSPLAMWIFSGYRRSYGIWLFHSARTLLKQDTQLNRRYTLSNSFFMIAWIWFCFFFTLYFESAMKSNLTLSSKKGYEFKDLEGVLNALETKGWSLVIQDDIGWDLNDYCKNRDDQCSRLQIQFKQAIHISSTADIFKEIPPKSVLFAGIHNHLVEQSDVAIMDRKSRLLFIKDSNLQTGLLSYAINKNLSKELEKLNKALEKMQGSYENFAGRYAHSFMPYRRIDSYSEFFELRLIYLWPLFRLCLGSIGVSIGVILVEIGLGESGIYVHLLAEECRCEEEGIEDHHLSKRKRSKTHHHLTRNSLISLLPLPPFISRRSQYTTRSNVI